MRLFFGLRNEGMRVKDDTGVCIPETGKMLLSKLCLKERKSWFGEENNTSSNRFSDSKYQKEENILVKNI